MVCFRLDYQIVCVCCSYLFCFLRGLGSCSDAEHNRVEKVWSVGIELSELSIKPLNPSLFDAIDHKSVSSPTLLTD